MTNPVDTFFSKHTDGLSSVFSFVRDPFVTACLSKKCKEATLQNYLSIQNEYANSILLKPYYESAVRSIGTESGLEASRKIVAEVYQTILKEASRTSDGKNFIATTLTEGNSKLAASRLEKIVREMINPKKDQDLLMLVNKICSTYPIPKFVDLPTGESLEIKVSRWMDAQNLTQVEGLDLSKSQLHYLSPLIGKLTSLKGLFLSENQLQSLPKEIGQLPNLKGLYLRANQFSHLLPEIGKLTELTTLNLSNNRLEDLPAEIGQLKKLKELYLRSNKLQVLPVEMRQLTQLQLMFIADNPLKSLKSEMTNLKYYEKFIIIQNHTTSLFKDAPNLKIFN